MTSSIVAPLESKLDRIESSMSWNLLPQDLLVRIKT